MKRKYINSYVRVMNDITMSEDAKKYIIRNCARYSTLQKIKNSSFSITVSKKEKTTDGI
ncbi:MAG: hypothetical protein UHK54_08955 [Acutalibacteraceae bacterium]|jgi:hypothetical protein|nr:hypothetical protein [Acutalibacteraceae bacterium]